MAEIELKKGYFIIVEPMIYTLKQRYSGKKRTGEGKESERTIGYFSRMEGTINRYIECCQNDVLDGERLSLEEYVKSIDRINKLAVQGLHDVLEKFPVK